MKVSRIKFILLMTGFVFILLSAFTYNKIKKRSQAQRVAQFQKMKMNTKEPVEILWNQFLVPRISAKNEKDLFYAIGAVQMHLRRTQLEFLRKLSQGRVSELIGKKGNDIDHFLRSINFKGIVDREFGNLSKETQFVLKYMAHGMNDYKSQFSSRPMDMIALGIKNEDWTAQDLATIHKFMSLDINWSMFAKLMEFIDRPYFKKLWDSFFKPDMVIDILKTSTDVSSNFSPTKDPKVLEWLGDSFTKSGSNAFAVGGRRTNSGSAMLSNDPHLGIMIPNFWLFVVLDSPKYKSMGYIMPSFPVPVVGRNHKIAWGGTNMWGLSTFLSEVSLEDLNHIKVRKEVLKNRFAFNTEIEIREIDGQPIITDTKLFKHKKALSLFWVGSQASDEVLAFLKLNLAKDWKSFRLAFLTYATSGQNFVYADKDGNVGKVAAIKQLQVPNGLEMPLKERPTNDSVFKNSGELPWFYNPVEMFIVSANDRWIVESGVQELSVFQSPNDRILRMRDLLLKNDKVDFKYIKEMHQDVFSISAFELKEAFVKRLDEFGAQNFKEHPSFSILKDWDGYYTLESQGALVFEVMFAALSEEFLKEKVKTFEEEELAQLSLQKLLTRSTSWRKTLGDLATNDSFFNSLTPWRKAMELAETQIAKFEGWGEFHQLTLAHPITQLPVPILKSFNFYQGPYPGGNETLFKAAHALDTKNANVTFGAQARWMTDLSSLNSNYFVLLGGQDGWMRSQNNNDQTDLWLKGQYIHVPFSKEAFVDAGLTDF